MPHSTTSGPTTSHKSPNWHLMVIFMIFLVTAAFAGLGIFGRRGMDECERGTIYLPVAPGAFSPMPYITCPKGSQPSVKLDD